MDDDELLRGALRVVLEGVGYEVLEAADGEAGLRLQRERAAELVLVDIFMPERDGLEVIKALRVESPEAKIIAMSAHAAQAVPTAAAAHGDPRSVRGGRTIMKGQAVSRNHPSVPQKRPSTFTPSLYVASAQRFLPSIINRCRGA